MTISKKNPKEHLQERGSAPKAEEPPGPALSEELLDEVFEQCHESTPTHTVEAIVIQIQLAREARARIVEEGIVVRDMRGSVIPHPAIAIESSATKLYTDLLRKAKA